MKIAQVALKTEMSEDTLRYYEKLGLLKPKRTAGGIRDYSEEDLQTLGFIQCMRKAGLSLEFLAEYLDLYQQGDSTIQARKELLLKQREILLAKMKDSQETLDRLNYKINHYEELILASRKCCDGKKGKKKA
jgi:DNA-binding transcriptional MerR regulator